MKLGLAILLIGFALVQTQSSLPSGGGLVIANLTFEQKMLKTPGIPKSMVSTEPPVIKPDPNLGRRDPNEDPEYAKKQENKRLAEMSRVGGIAHDDKQAKEPPDPTRLFYVFTAQMRNDSPKTITRVVWAYRVSNYPNMADIADTEFLCSTKIEPRQSIEIDAVARLPRVMVVDVAAQGAVADVPKPSINDFIIKQVQFSDGTTWQRPDWDPVILTRRGALKLKKGKCITL
ncbi:MAG TPA: hypothetical protein VF251_07835 [Pyrinomonadaceae bacterium]